MTAVANLPAYQDAELDTMADTVAHWGDIVAKALTSDAGRLRLRIDIRQRLQLGTLETLKVIEAAEQKHGDADLALRELGAEMLDRGEMPDATLRAYLVRALVRAPVTYRPGHNLADTWLRNIGIAVMVSLALAPWPHLRANRNRASKRRPSASTLVALALARHGHPLTEWQVERIYRDHNKLAERLAATIGPLTTLANGSSIQ